MIFVRFFHVLFSLWYKYPTAFNCERYLMIESRYTLIFNVKRTAVYFMVKDF